MFNSAIMGYYLTFDGGSGTGKGTLIKWCEEHLTSSGKKVKVLRDNKIDILRDYGALMMPWCKKNEVDRAAFMFPLFVAGFKMSDRIIETELENCDFLLRDRSFVSSLAYRAASGDLRQEQIWDIFISYVGLRIPDLAIITDAEVDTAISREQLRKQNDIGLGGKMSGDRENRIKIRNHFLALPEVFEGRMNVVIVRNNGKFTEDEKIIQKRIAASGGKIFDFMEKKGIKL